MKINSAKSIAGTIGLPGDKSISHRAAIFSAMAVGETHIRNYATSADCAATLKCLAALGVGIVREGSNVVIRGVGKKGFSPSDSDLDCENSGTTMRLLSGLLAGQGFGSVLIGDQSLRKRPMKRVIEPLSLMNAKIEAVDNRAPLKIWGKNPLRSINFELPAASAQTKSCILLAGLNADGETSILERIPTRDHTERMLRWFGVDVREIELSGAKKLSISGDSSLTAKDLHIPADVSSAAFFIVAAACLKDSAIVIPNVGLNPSRTALISVLQEFGADIEVFARREICNEPVGSLRVRGNSGILPKPAQKALNGRVIANLIDEIPILAVAGTQLENGLEIRNASELRIKESDRIAAVVSNLRKMNATIEEFEDGFRVENSELKGAVVDSFGDHRIAMAFAVAGLLASGETEIVGAECSAVSFPGFFDTLSSVINEGKGSW